MPSARAQRKSLIKHGNEQGRQRRQGVLSIARRGLQQDAGLFHLFGSSEKQDERAEVCVRDKQQQDADRGQGFAGSLSPPDPSVAMNNKCAGQSRYRSETAPGE